MDMNDSHNHWVTSNTLLHQALKSIPTGAQTFSKSYLQFPQDHSPLFAERAYGARVWDVDGHDYVDCIMGLGSVALGYGDADVNAAICDQLGKGITFSLSSTLEMELAETLIRLIPCAEMVRYGKTGSDATSAAIRLARAYTQRDIIVACGYHGWHDWFIGSTSRWLGVPQCIRDLTLSLPFNDLDAVSDLFQRQGDHIAALILEPASLSLPLPGYLEGLRKITDHYGSILIFDEMVTGFRYHLGGAQAYFDVIPDLATFGKALANGMPLSAVVGKRSLMQLMDTVFFSGTFGGETLSLAASLATLNKIEREGAVDYFWQKGKTIRNHIISMIEKNGLQQALNICGSDCLLFIQANPIEEISAATIRSFMIGQMIVNHVLTLGAVMLSLGFRDQEEAQLLHAFDRFAYCLAQGLHQGNLIEMMPYPPIEPIFQIRT